MPSVIVLLTDFGHLDPYVGQMKGALLSHAPQVQLIDLTHEIMPHCIGQAQFMLQNSRRYFPENSIFLTVVDPGVGTSRPMLMAQDKKQFFLAPDNGLLSFLHTKLTTWWQLPAPSSNCSHTFHGRDLLAPVAAQLALGIPPDALGTLIKGTSIVRQNLEPAIITPEHITCRVVHVDRFGNCLLNLPIQNLSSIYWKLSTGHNIRLVHNYAQLGPEEIGLLAGSQQVMELAMYQKHCSRFLGLTPGQSLCLSATLGY